MGCCSAIKCSNRDDKGPNKIKLFRFPADKRRREKWVLNSRRGSWIPTASSRLCEKHFEESQFESNRADGWKKLKLNAVPTLFNVPNPPPRIDPLPRNCLYKNRSGKPYGANESFRKQSTSLQLEFTKTLEEDNMNLQEQSRSLHSVLEEPMLDMGLTQTETAGTTIEEKKLVAKVVTLQDRNAKLQKEIDDLRDCMSTFLSKDQVKFLQEKKLGHWQNDTIVKGLKFRFALSVHGYEYLRNSGYPLPAYSTIMRRIQSFNLECGIFQDVLDLLKHKVDSMDYSDRFCVLSYDEMAISCQQDYDKFKGIFVGNVTLGSDTSILGSKLFLVIVRGVKNPWKQAIACHVTPAEGKDYDIIKNFLEECVLAIENSGLYVVALSSDLDVGNRRTWTNFGIKINYNSPRVNSINFNGHDIFAIPDVCHVIKNLKAAILRQVVYLPVEYVEIENLPTNEVRGSYIKSLYMYELECGREIRRLFHLKYEDVEPTNFEKMNVGAAIRFFSLQTAVALEMAVEENVLPREALTTAHFIRVVHDWFEILNSKVRKTSITSRNCDRKYIFLHGIIDLFHETVFKKNWKPLNFAMILATLSFCDIAEFLFQNGYEYVIGHRFTQDATENIFSQIRRKEGKMPSALKGLRGVRMISVAQFISDVKRSNYCNDSDKFLLDLCNSKKEVHTQTCALSVNNDVKKLARVTEIEVFPIAFTHFCNVVDEFDAKNMYHLAGSTTNAVVKHICNECIEFLLQKNLPECDFVLKAQRYTGALNKSGLKNPCLQTFHLILFCEHYYKINKSYILQNGTMSLMELIIQKANISFRMCCCEILRKIVKHFFTVRSFSVKNFSENCKKKKIVYGSATAKRARTT